MKHGGTLKGGLEPLLTLVLMGDSGGLFDAAST